MRPGFRPLLEPPCHRRASGQRPILCFTVTLVAVLFVLMTFGMSAWNAYVHKFGKNTLVLYSRDEVALNQVASDFSVTFCDGYELSLYGSGQAYLLPHQAKVNVTYTHDMPIEIHQQSYREFNVRYTYLLRMSSVNVTACGKNGPVSPEAEIVFIQGDDNFKRWRRNSRCPDCVLDRVHIPGNAFCDKPVSQLPRLYRRVDSDDRYFLVVFNGRPVPHRHLLFSGIVLKGVISRTQFDLSDAEKVCYIVNSSSCHFDLPWKSDKDVVVKFDGQTWNSFSSTLTTQCQVRIIFWVCLFGILPVVCILLILTMFGCFLYKQSARKCSRTECRWRETQGERTRLLQDHDRQFVNQVPQNEENGKMAIQQG